jgi:hypothetical protein
MNIANKSQFWTSRMNGEDPTALEQIHHNDDFSQSGTGAGSATVSGWKIDASSNSLYYSLSPSTDDYSIVVGLKYLTQPTTGAVLLELDNGTHKVEVQATANATMLNLVGATTVQIKDLDLLMTEDDAYITILRLTLSAGGSVKAYIHEALTDEMGEDMTYSLTGATGSSKTIKFGADSGVVEYGSVYATHHGAFSPDELSMSAFYQQIHNNLGLAIINQLRQSKRLHLKTIPDSSIVYGYDLSSQMIVRLAPPTIHVVVMQVDSPEFSALAGTSIDNRYTVQIFVTTKGVDYENAYKYGLRIVGDAFDEIYTSTGLNATTDNLIGYTLILDAKLDSDEQVCVHRLNFQYERREKMLMR